MKKQQRNATFHTPGHQNHPLAIRRETVRVLTGDDLVLIAAGSSTVVTERTTTNVSC